MVYYFGFYKDRQKIIIGGIQLVFFSGKFRTKCKTFLHIISFNPHVGGIREALILHIPDKEIDLQRSEKRYLANSKLCL